MDKRLLNGFEKQEDERGKIKRSITIDWELDLKLKKLEINVSDLCNQFLWYYLKKRGNDKTEKEENE